MDVGLDFSPVIRLACVTNASTSISLPSSSTWITHGRSGESSTSPNCTSNACSNFPIAS